MLQPLVKAAALLAFLSCSALAQSSAAPTGDVILTVSNTPAGEVPLDLALLEEMGSETIETSTIWTEGVQSFEGVPLHVLVERLGIDGEALKATAINDYAVDIPAEDAVAGGPIIAYRLNGELMSVRDKGPLWLVYPYDKAPEFQTEVIYARSIWQLDRIEVVE